MPDSNVESTLKVRLGRLVAKTVIEYLSTEEHKHEFEDWYQKTYGKPYIWNKAVVL